jgi:hypothetical protein
MNKVLAGYYSMGVQQRFHECRCDTIRVYTHETAMIWRTQKGMNKVLAGYYSWEYNRGPSASERARSQRGEWCRMIQSEFIRMKPP